MVTVWQSPSMADLSCQNLVEVVQMFAAGSSGGGKSGLHRA